MRRCSGRRICPGLRDTGHCQLKRPWHAPRVGDAAARVGELPRSSRARPKKGALGPSLQERYDTHEDYIARIEAAAAALVADRLLLPADAERYVKAAKECDRF